MDNRVDEKVEEGMTIDLLQIFKALWHRAWLIVLAAVILGGAGFSIAKFAIAPTYSSSILMYVNNRKANEQVSGSISSADISAAKSLVSTYSEILKSRTTMEQVIERAGLDYTWKELASMVTASAANNTEVMRVSVVTEDPEEAAMIANTIAEVLPIRISFVIEGANVKLVDEAVPDYHKVAPSITKYTAIGMLLGIVLAVAFAVIETLLDDTIHNEEYILRNFNCPILARIPDLTSSGGKHYGYYQSSSAEKK